MVEGKCEKTIQSIFVLIWRAPIFICCSLFDIVTFEPSLTFSGSNALSPSSSFCERTTKDEVEGGANIDDNEEKGQPPLFSCLVDNSARPIAPFKLIVTIGWSVQGTRLLFLRSNTHLIVLLLIVPIFTPGSIVRTSKPQLRSCSIPLSNSGFLLLEG